MIKSAIKAATGTSMIALLLAGCGGSSNSDAEPPSAAKPPSATSKFSKSADWTMTLPVSGNSMCYDFDAAAEVAGCVGNAWDIKLTSGGRSATLWTNSGVSGTGQGGAFRGPFDHTWTGLSAWTDATVDPIDGAMPAAVYFKDSASNAFTGSNTVGLAAFEYDVADDHLFYPNHRVFLITTDSTANPVDPIGTPAAPVFALQLIGYYGGAGGVASGYPRIRWVDRADSAAVVREATINASESAKWVYFDLITGTESSQSGTWQIAFNRYNVKLNGGTSGTGTVAGFVGRQPVGFYEADGTTLVPAKFVAARPADTLADLTASDIAIPAAANRWIVDANASELNPNYQGTFPNALDFGWYSYYPTATAAQAAGLPAVAHLLRANPDRATLVRSGEGNSYARMHVTSIQYADPNDSSSASTWTLAFDVQPAP